MSSEIERKIRARLPIIRFMQVVMPLPVMHWLVRKAMVNVKLPPDITRKPVSADGVPGDWLIPQAGKSDCALLYLHGGGFVIPQTPNHLRMGACLAEKSGLPTLMPDYRVAPRHPFPTPLDDCLTAYRYLLKQGIAADRIVIAGDSAGANLTLATLMALRENGEPLPAGAACLSPAADLTAPDDETDARKDDLLPARARRFYRRSYVGNNDARNPLISPLFGDWHGLPPLLIHAGEDEVLRDDAVRIQQSAAAAGMDVQLEIFPHMWHVWQINLQLPQALVSLDKIADFLRIRVNNPQAETAPAP